MEPQAGQPVSTDGAEADQEIAAAALTEGASNQGDAGAEVLPVAMDEDDEAFELLIDRVHEKQKEEEEQAEYEVFNDTESVLSDTSSIDVESVQSEAVGLESTREQSMRLRQTSWKQVEYRVPKDNLQDSHVVAASSSLSVTERQFVEEEADSGPKGQSSNSALASKSRRRLQAALTTPVPQDYKLSRLDSKLATAMGSSVVRASKAPAERPVADRLNISAFNGPNAAVVANPEVSRRQARVGRPGLRTMPSEQVFEPKEVIAGILADAGAQIRSQTVKARELDGWRLNVERVAPGAVPPQRVRQIVAQNEKKENKRKAKLKATVKPELRSLLEALDSRPKKE
jgi:hypothetical protein